MSGFAARTDISRPSGQTAGARNYLVKAITANTAPLLQTAVNTFLISVTQGLVSKSHTVHMVDIAHSVSGSGNNKEYLALMTFYIEGPLPTTSI